MFIVGEDAAINNDPGEYYLACRWNYAEIGKQLRLNKAGVKQALRHADVLVTNVANGRSRRAKISDWGPNKRTGRSADLSPKLMKTLGLETDDDVKIEVYVKP